jgi:transcriptional regulator of arginine metabolism
MSSKVQRQQAIARLIAEFAVASQPQLVELLEGEGIPATQATVSRDLEDLGAVKVRVPGGETVYAIPEYAPDRIAPEDQLRRVMGEWVAEVRHSGNVVVLRTPPGCAHVVASALDRSGLKGTIGTVAGDDTLMVIAEETLGGAKLSARLRQLAGLPVGRVRR